MRIAGTIHANLRAALQSARRLKDGPVHPDTVKHWSDIVAIAREAGGEALPFTTRELTSDLEHEISARRSASGE